MTSSPKPRESALDREMRKAAALGITITTSSAHGDRPHPDSAAGRIQAAAERHGIAGTTTKENHA